MFHLNKKGLVCLELFKYFSHTHIIHLCPQMKSHIHRGRFVLFFHSTKELFSLNCLGNTWTSKNIWTRHGNSLASQRRPVYKSDEFSKITFYKMTVLPLFLLYLGESKTSNISP